MGSTAHDIPRHGAVVDIGGSNIFTDVRERLISTLEAEYSAENKTALPDELLYDDKGLDIWAEIISTKEFYQTADEIAIFDKHGPEIVERLRRHVVIVDLGAGDTGKVQHLLSAVEGAKLPATYLALDISKASLETNVKYLVGEHSHSGSTVTCAGIWGTFEDGMGYVQKIVTSRLFLSLGSVLCNDPWPQALAHLKHWANTLRRDDLLLVGMDGHTLPACEDKIWAAYHTREDLFRAFFLNGFQRLNQIVGHCWFRPEDWDIRAELEDTPTTRHRFYLRAKRQLRLDGLSRVINEGDEYDWFDSHKYGEDDVTTMCSKAGLVVIKVYRTPGSEFRQYLLRAKSQGDPREDADSAVAGLD
jgi:EasF-like predicted methyltransferase